jgi:hypothetical protein
MIWGNQSKNHAERLMTINFDSLLHRCFQFKFVRMNRFTLKLFPRLKKRIQTGKRMAKTWKAIYGMICRLFLNG